MRVLGSSLSLPPVLSQATLQAIFLALYKPKTTSTTGYRLRALLKAKKEVESKWIARDMAKMETNGWKGTGQGYSKRPRRAISLGE